MIESGMGRGGREHARMSSAVEIRLMVLVVVVALLALLMMWT